MSPPNLLRRLANATSAFAICTLIAACGGGGGGDGGGSGGGGAGGGAGVVDVPQAPAGADAGTPPAPEQTLSTPEPADPVSPPAVTRSATFAGSTEDFQNPERGWYVTPKDTEMTAPALSAFVTRWNTRLFHYRLALDPYRGTVLPQSYLDRLDAYFAAGRAAGVKFIVMASYNFDSAGQDAPMALVLQHIAQLGPVLTRNADVIPFVKAGFIGAYGEWWGSTNGLDSDANKLLIKTALMSAVPAPTIVHFRYPNDIATWHPGNPAAAAAARIGLHNDCYLANDTDAHTYWNGLADPMRDFIKAMTASTGSGAETCENVANFDQARLSCAEALREHAAYHLSWLNGDYARTFIDSWKAGGCFAEIGRRLGYRLTLDSVSHPAEVSRGMSTTVRVKLDNGGWSRMHARRALVVTLRHSVTGQTVAAAGGDLSAIAGGASALIDVAIAIPLASATGDYDVQISAPDVWASTAGDPRFAVRFANSDAGAQRWNATTARFATGTQVRVR